MAGKIKTPIAVKNNPQQSKEEKLLKTISIVAVVLVLVVSSAFVVYDLINSKYTKKLNDINMQNSSLSNQVLELNDSIKQLKEGKSMSICVDTDGGKDYNVAGAIKYNKFDPNGSITTSSDTGDICTNANISGQLKGNVLREYYCDTNNQVQYDHYVCPKGCYKGACK
jgi:cell division protein FtsL